jgi:hypothetical protein
VVGPEAVDDPRPAAARVRLRRRRDEAGVGERAEVPADRVRVQPEPVRELRDVETVGRRPELCFHPRARVLDDGHFTDFLQGAPQAHR